MSLVLCYFNMPITNVLFGFRFTLSNFQLWEIQSKTEG